MESGIEGGDADQTELRPIAGDPAKAPLPGRVEGTRGGGSGLLVDEELARAVSCESALALRYWFRSGARTGLALSRAQRNRPCLAAGAGPGHPN